MIEVGQWRLFSSVRNEWNTSLLIGEVIDVNGSSTLMMKSDKLEAVHPFWVYEEIDQSKFDSIEHANRVIDVITSLCDNQDDWDEAVREYTTDWPTVHSAFLPF